MLNDAHRSGFQNGLRVCCPLPAEMRTVQKNTNARYDAFISRVRDLEAHDQR